MATSINENIVHIEIKFFTKQQQYAVADTPFKIPSNSGCVELNNLVNKLLHPDDDSDSVVNFDFLVNGEFLRHSLEEHMRLSNIALEGLVEIEYVLRQAAPEQGPSLQHDDWVSSVHAANNCILTGSYDNGIRIWSTSGELLVTIPGHTAPVKCVTWLQSDEDDEVKLFISGGHDEMCHMWEWNQTKNSVDCVRVCRGHCRSVDCVSVSPDKSMFATGSWDQMLKIWSTESRNGAKTIKTFNLSESDELEEVGPKKKQKTTEHKVPIKVPRLTLSGHSEAVSSVRWLEDGSSVCTASWDHTIRMWDVKSAQMSSRINAAKVFFDIDYSPLNRLLVAGCADQYVRIYDPRSAGGESIVKSTFTSHTGWVVSVVWSPTDEHQFISGSYDKILKLWDKRSPKAPLYDIIDHEDRILCCDWSIPQYMLSGGVDNRLRMYTASNNSS